MMTRARAALIRLTITAVLFGALWFVIERLWYPGVLFFTDGGWQGLKLILAVDLVLGPLLTLVVYRPGKRGLKLDLGLIGALQVLALCVGLWFVYQERPLAMVYADGWFLSVTAREFEQGHIAAPARHKLPDDQTPPWVMIDLQVDPDQQTAIRQQANLAAVPIHLLHELYEPFSPGYRFLSQELAIERVLYADRHTLHLLWLRLSNGSLEKFAFFAYGGRYRQGLMAFDRESLEYRGFFPVEPPLSHHGDRESGYTPQVRD
jgi:hypothetical protein